MFILIMEFFNNLPSLIDRTVINKIYVAVRFNFFIRNQLV